VLIIVTCVGMSLGSVFAQNGGTVRGQITDLTPAQDPIEGVEVKIVAQDGNKEWTTTTDAKGEYKHAGLPPGRYLISISKDGYDARVGKPVAIVEGGDHFVPLKMSKKGRIELFKVQPAEKMNIVIKQRIVSLLQRAAESVGKRYDLEEADVKTLHRSILDSIEGALEQGGDLSTFAKPMEEGNMALLEMLLSHPVCQAAFAKHLSEVQLQDYMEFTEARRQRDRQAVVHWITVALDKELSLTADQRETVMQSLLDKARSEAFPNAMNALRISSQQAAQLAHYRLKVSLDGVLSEAQSKVWEGLVNASANRERVLVFVPEAEIKNIVEDKQLTVILEEPVKHIEMEKKVKIVIGDIVIDQPGKQPWIELNADIAGSQEQMMEIAEAKLAAHTELLGTLDERAARRLALAAKGLAQQYFEAHDQTREAISREVEADLMKKVEDGKMTREEAAAMLNFTVKDGIDRLLRDEGLKIDVTSYPLYQQAIKDVLSEEAFARYSAHQVKRAALHQQALRDVVVACMDMQLLLDDMQREQLETAALRLVPTLFSERISSTLMFFQLFPQTVDFEVLTPWQRGEFERVFGPIAWRR
jgi:hypothetical protein